MQVKAYPISNSLYNRLNLNYQLSNSQKELFANLIRTGERVYVLESLGKRPDIHAILNSELNGAFIGCTHKEPYLINDKNHVTNIDCHIAVLYRCEFCKHISDAIGQYFKHIFECHHEHFNEIVHQEINPRNLSELLYDNDPLNPRWTDNVEIETNESDHLLVKYVSDDGDQHEIIELSRDFNDYGVPFVTVELKQYGRDDELEYSDVLCQHECDLSQRELNRIDKNSDKEREDWTHREQWAELTTYRVQFSIAAYIEEEWCPCNISHYHIYKAVRIVMCESDMDKIKYLLAARDTIISLYRAHSTVKKQ